MTSKAAFEAIATVRELLLTQGEPIRWPGETAGDYWCRSLAASAKRDGGLQALTDLQLLLGPPA